MKQIGNGFIYRKDMLRMIAGAMNLARPDRERHHETVAYIAYRIASEMNLGKDATMRMVYAALLHDIGFVRREGGYVQGDLERERANTASIMSGIEGVEQVAQIIQFSAFRWDRLHEMADGTLVTEFRQGHIIFIANAVSNMVDPKIPILLQAEKINSHLRENAGTVFCPIASKSFFALSEREEFWFKLRFASKNLFDELCGEEQISLDETVSMSRMLSAIVDFRSPFTAMHSAGVSAAASKIALLLGMNGEEQKKMAIAGLLHDLGKLRISSAILEKNGKLDDEEFAVIKEHPFFTYELLSKVRGFDDIASWAGFHHEKLDGSGYPFHLSESEIPLGARIMTCADIFSALAEDRPYRKGLPKERTLAVLDENAERGFISKPLVALIRENYEEINEERETQARKSGSRYYKMNLEG